jgi:TusE/DsrC/DsvC family sulfur relay protein
MPVLEYKKKKIEVDEDGCLVHFEDWDENVARALAAKAGIEELTADRLNMLKYIRDYYMTYDFFPIVGSICKNVHEPKDCVHEKFISPLIAWKIAGLPHPEEPIVSLLEAGQSPG